MPRTERWNVAGGVFHMVSRFARDECWLERAGAREAYLELLGRAAKASDSQLLAYCLMSNHVHLVVVQGAAPLSRLMKSVHTGFAAFAHASRGRKQGQGPVFAGRPRMVLVERDEYLLELVRYVHNNPVRAGVVRAARNSHWSSHRAYIGKSAAPAWLRLGYALEHFGGGGASAAKKFDAFVDAGRRESRRPELSGAQDTHEAAEVRRALGDGYRMSDGVVGSKRFVAKMREAAGRSATAPGKRAKRGSERRVGPSTRPSLREVIGGVLELLELDARALEQRPKARACSHAKRLITWVWVHEYEGTQIEVSRALELETGAVSRHYGHALESAGAFDAQAAAVVALLRKRGRRPR